MIYVVETISLSLTFYYHMPFSLKYFSLHTNMSNFDLSKFQDISQTKNALSNDFQHEMLGFFVKLCFRSFTENNEFSLTLVEVYSMPFKIVN